MPEVTTERLRLRPFTDADVPALAAILAEPDVTKNITANGSTPERCAASAEYRIARHATGWREQGYGIWALTALDGSVAEPGMIIGWCGFTEPDIGEDPEILYGLAPQAWGQGLAQEAARASIDWLFAETSHGGVSAIIFGRLNPVSVAIIKKFGMTRRGTMPMVDFLPDLELARDVLEYEIWRLASGRTGDPEKLLFEAPFKGGQIASLKLRDLDEAERDFLDAAKNRPEFASIDRDDLNRRVRDAFREGVANSDLDWYHLARADWNGRG